MNVCYHVFEADKPISEENKQLIIKDVELFNKDYQEKLKLKWTKIPKRFKDKALGSISDYEGTDFICEVIVKGNKLKLLVAGQYLSTTGVFIPDMLVRRVLKRAVKDYITVIKDYSEKV